MSTKEFILQGFTTRTHANAVRELFLIPNIEAVFISVAFISESGVQQIEEQLRNHAANVTVFSGIRNDITSHQALTRILAITSQLYTVDTGSRTIVFHPKLYLVRGAARARMVIGSANLTLGGLNNNIEASLLLDFDLTEATDKDLIDGIEAQLLALPKDYPEHIVQVGSVAVLDEMLASGRLTDEMAIPPPRPSTSASGGTSDLVPRIKLKVVALRRALAKAKAAAKEPEPSKAPAEISDIATTKIPAETETEAPVTVPAAVGVELELVWESKPLTRRDLTIPKALNSHATGSINLDKGLLGVDVDQRHYFRDDVFNKLTWSSTKSPTVDEAYARFQLVMKGISYGEFDLRIGHTTDKNSASYKQNNAMTRLSWGPMREYIARADLIDRTLALYRDKADPTRFILEID